MYNGGVSRRSNGVIHFEARMPWNIRRIRPAIVKHSLQTTLIATSLICMIYMKKRVLAIVRRLKKSTEILIIPFEEQRIMISIG